MQATIAAASSNHRWVITRLLLCGLLDRFLVLPVKRLPQLVELVVASVARIIIEIVIIIVLIRLLVVFGHRRLHLRGRAHFIAPVRQVFLDFLFHEVRAQQLRLHS